ncbi:MAG: InlB B-repeat-containing protein [Lachnospiraceae bacterium]|nr:InlB B-repeat-containing protein [Lachnospiraceae bacterium]
MKNKRENGVVVVEASIVVTIVIMLISVMLFMGMMLYQQTLAAAMANQTASAVAQVYGNNVKDPFTGYIDIDKIYQPVTYSNYKTDSYMNIVTGKADIYAKYRLKSSRILLGGKPEVKVEIVKKKNELLKSQIVVTIEDEYKLPLAGFFGAAGLFKYKATGRADCVDYLDYLNGAEAIGNPERANPAPIFEDKCLVEFVPNTDDGITKFSTHVRTGKSISTSSTLTRSMMPREPEKYIPKFEFVRWVKADGITFTETTDVIQSMKVYGEWKCTVTFDPTGGTLEPTTQKYIVNSQPKFPEPTRERYVFEGWYTQKDGAGKQYFDHSTPVTDNITLYANWVCAHNYITESTTPGTCQVKEIQHQKCEWCGELRDVEGVLGGHNMQFAGTIGYYCTDKKDVYRCTYGCGTEEIYDNPTGKHVWYRGAYEYRMEHPFHCESTGVKYGYDTNIDPWCWGKYHHCGAMTCFDAVCDKCGKYDGYWCGNGGRWVPIAHWFR